MKLVHVVSDPLPDSNSVNKRVAVAFIKELQALDPDVTVDTVDLNQNPPPYYDQDLFNFIWTPVSRPDYQPSNTERSAAEYMLQQTALLREADLLLLSAPVWNYYLPAVLKAWIDQVLSPGQMFDLGESGRRPLHRIRTLVNVVSAGGWVSENGVAQSLLHLLNESFLYAGIENHHDLLIEAQEPALFPDHVDRETEALALAGQIAGSLSTGLPATD